MTEPLVYFDENQLVSRLTRGLKKHPREVILLVGSPLSAPIRSGGPGVPGVAGILEVIKQEFVDDHVDLVSFEKTIQEAGMKGYQAAFSFLQGTRGQSVANKIVQQAVLAGLLSSPPFPVLCDDDCRRLEAKADLWFLSPATEAIGRLIARQSELFGRTLLTTNFDPLIEISVRKAGGHYYRTTLHADGNLQQTEADGCHIVHLHGYWYGSDTLHTARQLVQDRPVLKASLTQLLRGKLIVVCGYGGWDDVFTSTLLSLVRDDPSDVEVLWTFHSPLRAFHKSCMSSLHPAFHEDEWGSTAASTVTRSSRK